MTLKWGFFIDDFLELLRIAHIGCIIDVRSVPFSVHYPQYNKDELKVTFKKYNLTYLHFGLIVTGFH
jgi:hypothetical protein